MTFVTLNRGAASRILSERSALRVSFAPPRPAPPARLHARSAARAPSLSPARFRRTASIFRVRFRAHRRDAFRGIGRDGPRDRFATASRSARARAVRALIPHEAQIQSRRLVGLVVRRPIRADRLSPSHGVESGMRALSAQTLLENVRDSNVSSPSEAGRRRRASPSSANNACRKILQPRRGVTRGRGKSARAARAARAAATPVRARHASVRAAAGAPNASVTEELVNSGGRDVLYGQTRESQARSRENSESLTRRVGVPARGQKPRRRALSEHPTRRRAGPDRLAESIDVRGYVSGARGGGGGDDVAAPDAHLSDPFSRLHQSVEDRRTSARPSCATRSEGEPRRCRRLAPRWWRLSPRGTRTRWRS